MAALARCVGTGALDGQAGSGGHTVQALVVTHEGSEAVGEKLQSRGPNRAQGLADFFSGTLPEGSLKRTPRPDLALSRHLPTQIFSARRQTKTGPTPQPEKVIITGTLEHLHPTTLLIGENVRDNAALDPQFVASVREHGVLQPITAIRTNAGIEVRDGQRRTLAAREAKLDTMPVYVLDGQASTTRPSDAIHQADDVAMGDDPLRCYSSGDASACSSCSASQSATSSTE
jgi:hypothetical protein